MTWKTSVVVLAQAAAMLSAGCVVGPDYKKPELTVPQQFRGQETADAASVGDLVWSSVFDDPALQQLITRALANNYDLQAAAARIEEAQALIGVAKSEALPQIGYDAAGGGQRSFVPTQQGAGAATYGSIGGALSMAWEFDVWGRIRRSTEAAEANLFAAEDVRRGVQLTLVSELATAYYSLLELDRELAIAQGSEQVYKKTLDLFTDRYNAGRDNRLPVERTQGAYQESLAKLQDIKRLIAQQEDAIGILTGGYPGDVARGAELTTQRLPATPIGSTTALLQRRPDILGAEERMKQANAEIGVAVANYFPRIGLSALVGGVGVDFNNRWDGFGLWSAALGASGPIFTGGRLQSVEKERRAELVEMVAQYRKTVITAFQETSDALAAQKTLVDRRTALAEQVAALQRSADLALDRYTGGRAGYYEVLEAQQELFPAQYALAQTQRDQLLAVVSLYKALGGGWQLTTAETSAQTPGPQDRPR